MNKKPIHSDEAPAAIGPYSQAIQVGDTVYLSGQIPLDPASGELIEGEFADRCRRVFDNLAAVARAADAGLDDVVKLNVFLTDLGRFSEVNEIMSGYFNEPYPARAAVQVAALPKGVDVEMDAILVRSQGQDDQLS